MPPLLSFYFNMLRMDISASRLHLVWLKKGRGISLICAAMSCMLAERAVQKTKNHFFLDPRTQFWRADVGGLLCLSGGGGFFLFPALLVTVGRTPRLSGLKFEFESVSAENVSSFSFNVTAPHSVINKPRRESSVPGGCFISPAGWIIEPPVARSALWKYAHALKLGWLHADKRQKGLISRAPVCRMLHLVRADGWDRVTLWTQTHLIRLLCAASLRRQGVTHLVISGGGERNLLTSPSQSEGIAVTFSK